MPDSLGSWHIDWENELNVYRSACCVLSIIGCFFACLAWPLVALPIGIFLPESHYQLNDVYYSIGLSLLATTGYGIWISWIWIASCHSVSYRFHQRLQTLVILNHLGWGIVFTVVRHGDVMALLDVWPFTIWLLSNIAIASLALVFIEEAGFVAADFKI